MNRINLTIKYIFRKQGYLIPVFIYIMRKVQVKGIKNIKNGNNRIRNLLLRGGVWN